MLQEPINNVEDDLINLARKAYGAMKTFADTYYSNQNRALYDVETMQLSEPTFDNDRTHDDNERQIDHEDSDTNE